MPDPVHSGLEPGPPSRRKFLTPDIIAVGTILIITLLWLANPWLRPGHLAYDGDSMLLFYPAMEHARSELLAGRVPLWNPYKFMGSPFLANLMIPVFYPPLSLCLLLSQPLGMYICLFLHVLLAGLLTYGCARKAFWVSVPGSMLAGLSFSLSANLLCQSPHLNQACTMAWLPGVLWCVLRFGSSGRPYRDFFITLLVLGMMFLAGHPQVILFGGIIILWVGLAKIMKPGLCSFNQGRDETGRRAIPGTSRKVFVIGLTTSVLMALGLSSVHWLNALELAPHSIRNLQNVAFGASFSLPPRNLIALWFPDFFGSPGTTGYRGEGNFTETSVYCGFLVPVLALVGCCRKRCPLRQVTLLILLSGILVALGNHTPVYTLLLDLFDWLGRFRAPARAFCLVTLGLCLLAGQGMDRLTGLGHPAVAMGASETRIPSRLGRSILIVVMLTQLAGLAWFRFHLLGLKYQDLSMARSPLIKAGFDIGDWNEGRIYREFLTGVPVHDTSIPATQLKWSTYQPDLNILRGIRLFYGYEEGMLPPAALILGARYFRANLYSPAPDATLLGIMGIEYLVTDKPIDPGMDPRSGRPNLKLTYRDKISMVYSNTKYRGQVYTRGDFPGVDFGIMHDAYSEQKNTEKIQLVSADMTNATSEPAPQLNWKRIGAAEFHVQLNTPDVHELILTESWMPGWEAITDNNVEIPGERLGPFLTSFEIPDKTEFLIIRYLPDRWVYSWIVSLATLLVTLIFLLARTTYLRIIFR
jgi:hypothetical protein